MNVGWAKRQDIYACKVLPGQPVLITQGRTSRSQGAGKTSDPLHGRLCMHARIKVVHPSRVHASRMRRPLSTSCQTRPRPSHGPVGQGHVGNRGTTKLPRSSLSTLCTRVAACHRAAGDAHTIHPPMIGIQSAI